ncbi:MAG: alpha-amylase family glycosyl hydrolase [Ginsengibacter sp.]
MKNCFVYLLFASFLFFSCSPKIAPVNNSGETAVINGHPAWSEQSNIYEVNLRQYSATSSIKDFETHLPRLKKMGVEILWFMPITPIGFENRKANSSELGSYYASRDYTALNPEFGTMDDWKAMVKHAHRMGFKVITDWVANHSAPDNHWMKEHPDFYKRDKDGNTVYTADWNDTRNLNYDNREMRDSMIAAMQFWIRESDIDGFRCDAAYGPPEDFWKECIDSLKKMKDVFMLAEAEVPALHNVGFDESYAWTVMEGFIKMYAGKLTLLQVDSIINDDIQRFPKNSYRLYFTTNHDWNSWEGTEFERFGDAANALAVFSQTMYQSVPLMYTGQEIPLKRRLKFFVKDPVVWDKFDMAPFFSTLLHLRKKNPALAANASYKKLVTANDNAIFAYVRESGKHKVAVVLNLSNQPQSFTINDASINGNPSNVFIGGREKLNDTHVFSMEPWGYEVYDYR